MMKVSTAEKRVTSLQGERDELVASLRDIESVVAQQQADLEELWAKAERSGSDKAEAEVAKAEKAFDALKRQRSRKQAALKACEQDLQKAQAVLTQSQKEAAWKEIDGLMGDAEGLVAALEENPVSAEAWAELNSLARRMQSVYINELKEDRRGLHREILPNVGTRMGSVLDADKVNCQRVLQGMG